jgi:iron complex transport system ATP-binding protein
MAAPILSYEDLGLIQGEGWLFRGLDLYIGERDRLALIGRNGAGKTTLLQVASGRMHPTGGTADLLGSRLGRVDVFELRPRIGLSSASLADRIPAGETVRDVVLTAAYGVTGRWREAYEELDESRATDLLTAFGVAHLSDRTFGTLSEGERKRVQIARSLMTDPELLLLDEPAAGLDLGGREELVAALAELAGDHKSPVLVLVTHHVEEIPPGFTHLLLLREGKAFAAGPIDEVLTAETLSGAFDLPLVVEHADGRWSARAASAQG